MRIVDGKETTGFWDIERPQFRIDKGPAWLKIDRETGQLSGTPDLAGESEVVIVVSLQRDQRRLDGDALKWGVEKILASGKEDIGAATQSFVLDVQESSR
jgi:hypothetical protein